MLPFIFFVLTIAYLATLYAGFTPFELTLPLCALPSLPSPQGDEFRRFPESALSASELSLETMDGAPLAPGAEVKVIISTLCYDALHDVTLCYAVLQCVT